MAPTGAAWPSATFDPLTIDVLLEAQVTSRLIDHTARWLRAGGDGYYTISSAGHEANAAVAMVLRPSDPALLHYRSGGFYVARAGQVSDVHPVDDILRGILARATEPMAGGRHKVFGRHELAVIPQTSTIASHLPRAVGLAASLDRSDPEVEAIWPNDSVVVCSFGDASLNHSTAQGALNRAVLAGHVGERCPILFVCEDNGLGISVPTPPEWVERSTSDRPGLRWATADGADPIGVLETAAELVEAVRRDGTAAFLHLRTVRFLGHAGSDAESAYRDPAAVRADRGRDPILATARLLVEYGEARPDDLISWYLDERDAIRARACTLLSEPELRSAEEIAGPLAFRHPERVADAAEELVRHGSDDNTPRTLAQTINHTLDAALTAHPNVLVFGEDVAVKGGVYGVTRGLRRRHGHRQVFDTELDEQAILGLALGSALNGFLPIPEIQYLAYLHNAEDQLRGEAATLSFFSQGQYRNPMVVRIAAYAYQEGFGGHFHNDNSVAVLRDIPGLVIASPAHPEDAGSMLRTCLAAADADGAVCVFLEPIARYHTVDLHEEGDGLWTAPPTDDHVPLGTARTHGDGGDLTIVTWANGLFLALRAQRRLADAGIDVRVVDLRWLAPLPVDDLLREARATGRVLVADETRPSGGVGEAIITALVTGNFAGEIRRVCGVDTPIPLGPAAAHVLPTEDQIVDAARSLVASDPEV